MFDPRVSVVLPTYNAAEFIEDAIQSLLMGEYENFELLVIDDGSTDGTIDKVQSIDDNRLRLVQRDVSGLPSALNRGIAEAQGEYIARQDADDRSHQERLMRQVEFLDQFPDVAGVGTSAVLVSEDGNRLERRHVLKKVKMEDMEGGNPFIHGSMLLRKSAVEEVGGYDESLQYTEDYDLWVRLMNEYELWNIDEPLYELRLRDESIYGSQLSTVKLLRRFTYQRARETLREGTETAVAEVGAEAMLENLSASEVQSHHEEVAVESLRYGSVTRSRKSAFKSLRISRTILVPYLLIVLSFFPKPVIQAAITFGRHFKNRRIRKTNRKRDR